MTAGKNLETLVVDDPTAPEPEADAAPVDASDPEAIRAAVEALGPAETKDAGDGVRYGRRLAARMAAMIGIAAGGVLEPPTPEELIERLTAIRDRLNRGPSSLLLAYRAKRNAKNKRARIARRVSRRRDPKHRAAR